MSGSTQERLYKVANHIFSLKLKDNFEFIPLVERAYSPFQIEGGEPLFSIEEVEDINIANPHKIFTDDPQGDGFVKIDLYRYEDVDGYYIEFTQFGSQEINGKLTITRSGDVKVALFGSSPYRWMTFTNVVQVAFFIMTSALQTVMLHASAILYNGKGYLFLGRSGTGKSTHSRMWLNGVEGSILMNDDHPIVRLSEDGTPIVYGSPWSGKTHCYKNLDAPVGGIVRIRQEKENSLRRLKTIESYGSVICSCSGFPVEKGFSDGKDESVRGIISKVKCWELGCLPNIDAAIVCMKGVTA